MTSKPRAWRFGASPAEAPEDGEIIAADGVRISRDPDEIIDPPGEGRGGSARRRRIPWGSLLASSAFALVVLALGVWAEALVRSLFGIAPWLGWAALALALLAATALVAVVGRELSGLWRERKIEHLRAQALSCLADEDPDAARALVDGLVSFYAGRPEAARGRAEVEAARESILDARDRLILAERALLADRDARARRAVADAARQVSLVTAVSPRAIIDVAFVLYSSARLLSRVAVIYGGRPGALGFMRLARSAIAHLTVTGGMAMGDDLIQQALGLGLAARVSARMGEGVVNGLMTARLGLAAIAVCRPLPFVGSPPPGFRDVAGGLLSGAKGPPEPDAAR
ncbi:MAG: TIGR01620 family protein [Salinarimonadaceae bacterium]|nr:MAG: TIGR01620 family protein [Salinarimonadaceae bacterium]